MGITLVRSRSNGISRTVEVEYSPDAGLVFGIHDIGEGASLNDDEYEAWYTISPANLAAFCELVGIAAADPLSSVKGKYSGESFGDLYKVLSSSKLVEHSAYW